MTRKPDQGFNALAIIVIICFIEPKCQAFLPYRGLYKSMKTLTDSGV